MLDEYQQQAQQVQDQLEQSHQILEEMTTHLVESYPPEERTYRMGKAMGAIASANQSVLQAARMLHDIEWPTEDLPR